MTLLTSTPWMAFTVFAPDVFCQQPRVDLGHNDIDTPKVFGYMIMLDAPKCREGPGRDGDCQARSSGAGNGRVASLGYLAAVACRLVRAS